MSDAAINDDVTLPQPHPLVAPPRFDRMPDPDNLKIDPDSWVGTGPIELPRRD